MQPRERRAEHGRASLTAAGAEATRRAGDAARTLYSVAQIQHILRVESARAQRYGYPLVCSFVTIDQLGALRDDRGYEAKERLLEVIVALLARATRPSDYLGRTPDDRLMIVTPHTEAAGARALASRLLAGARALDLEKHGLALGSATQQVSLSIGTCAHPGGGLLFHDSLVQAAEAALNEAESQGGDRHVERASGAVRL